MSGQRTAGLRRLASRASAEGTSVATKLALVVVLVAMLSLAAATIVGVRSGRDLGRDLYEEQLRTERFSSGFDIALHMRGLTRSTSAAASSPAAAVAIDAFAAGLEDLEASLEPPSEAEVDAVTEALVESTFDPLLAAGRDPDLGDIVPDASSAIYLQNNYVVDIGAIDRPADVDDAGDGSDWSAAHAIFHPAYRGVIDQDGIVDLYLVEADTSTIVYSVTKGPDLGTSLETGPFSGSLLAAAVDDARASQDSAVIGDIGFYDPAIAQPVGAIAAPVRTDGALVGFVVLLYDGETLTEILTDRSTPDQTGTTSAGEASSFLIGSDGLLRTDPAGFVTDPSALVAAADEAGVITDEQRTEIELTGTTVLVASAADATLAAAIDGDTSISERSTLIGGSVFTTTEALDLPGVEWFIVSDIGVEEATTALERFEDVLVVGAAAFVVALTFWAVAWANRIISPIRVISDRVAALNPEVSPVQVPPRSPTEFHQLADSFAAMRRSLVEQHRDLESARADRIALMRRMLPTDVADRIAAGETQELEQVPQATVVVVIVTGLGEFVRAGSDDADQDFVGHLHAQLDEVGLLHGIDRVKIVGDAYFGVCGHDRPYIDHGPRVISFALDARDALREIAERTSSSIDLAAGIHTGPVTVGLTGGERLIYDVFGETVSLAHQLARLAPVGEVIASDATRQLLPSSIELSAVGDAAPALWRVDAEHTEVMPS